jgi:MYXO-CTERM domain-containing protein
VGCAVTRGSWRGAGPWARRVSLGIGGLHRVLPWGIVQGLRRGSWVVVAGLVVAGASIPASAAPRSHHGDALVQVDAWPDDVAALGLDVWTHETAVPSVLARVTLQQRAMLDASGYDYVIVDPDLGPRVEGERERLLGAPPVLGGLDPGFYQDYRRFEAVLTRLAALVAAQPGRVTTVEIGDSLEGRQIQGVRITNPGAADRPVVLVLGCQHAREWISVASVVFAAEQFATAPSGGALDGLLDQVELVVVPVVNPDGYVYSWDVERFWRKNRRDGTGVDLNRNWSVAWGGEGASPDPLEENYHGVAPFSEPETLAMRDFIAADPDMIALFDVHSYGQLLLYPWGYGVVDSPDDELFADLAADMADAMVSPHEQWYVPLQSAELYPASGNALDWAYGVHGLYAVTAELRPAGDEEVGFLLPPQFIVPTGDEVVSAIAELIESSVALGPGEPGDDDGAGAETGDGPTTGVDGTAGELDGTTAAGSGGGFDEAGTPTPPDGETDPGPPPADTFGEGEAGTESGAPLEDDEADEGCGCRHEQGSDGAWWTWSVLALALHRRRR